MEREVIRIEQEGNKPVEFTHVLNHAQGWSGTDYRPRDFDKIVYLGLCPHSGDMFAAYSENGIGIYKGHLNSGKY